MNQYLEKYVRRGKKREKTNGGVKDLLKRMLPARREGQSGEEFAKQRMLWGLKCGIYALAMLAVLRGVLVTARANISVSNSVNGKELPIYCVETSEPKVALTFDAAWGNARLMAKYLLTPTSCYFSQKNLHIYNRNYVPL